ncbi:hypothetical protein MLD38_035884 [Melastoma candidum]|uniref:Uncharacterized protein n=1 Tax=Melastoma candidum TaxID=119954 RepID=A0ACB9LID4_9MYRT|nr:hypothetical protein MLD38_035884 [Melastoma candidum]
MGFLDHLWDETLAGPRPDSGHEFDAAACFGDDSSEEATRVTRKITIVEPPRGSFRFRAASTVEPHEKAGQVRTESPNPL